MIKINLCIIISESNMAVINNVKRLMIIFKIIFKEQIPKFK